MSKHLLIGLTGGIASGKTEVAGILKKLGAAIISADRVGKEVMESSPEMLNWVYETFGGEYIGSDGRLLRKKLGNLVFSHPEKKRLLDEKIFLPLYERLHRLIEKASKSNEVIVVDAAMVFEWGIESDFDLILTVVSSREKVFQRLSSRDGFDRERIENRIDSQIPAAEKAARSHWIIENEDSLEELGAAVERFWQAKVEPELQKDG